MNYGIFRIKPIKNEGYLVNITKHNSRANLDMPSLKYCSDKYGDGLSPIRGTGDYLKDFNNALFTHTEFDENFDITTGCCNTTSIVPRIQKNSILGYDIVFTTSESIGDDAVYKEWYKDNLEFLIKHFGKDNVHSAFIHDDEQFEGKKTPNHMHIFVTPFWEGKGRWILGAKHFTGTTNESSGKQKLSKLQDDYYNEVSKKYGLDRGLKGSKAKHLDPSVFKARKEQLNEYYKKNPDAVIVERMGKKWDWFTNLSTENQILWIEKAFNRLKSDDIRAEAKEHYTEMLNKIQKEKPELLSLIGGLLNKINIANGNTSLKNFKTGLIKDTQGVKISNYQEFAVSCFAVGFIKGLLAGNVSDNRGSVNTIQKSSLVELYMYEYGLDFSEAVKLVEKKREAQEEI